MNINEFIVYHTNVCNEKAEMKFSPLNPLKKHFWIVSWHSMQFFLEKKPKMFQPIRGSGGHAGFWITPKNNNTSWGPLEEHFCNFADFTCSSSGDELVNDSVNQDARTAILDKGQMDAKHFFDQKSSTQLKNPQNQM